MFDVDTVTHPHEDVNYYFLEEFFFEVKHRETTDIVIFNSLLIKREALLDNTL